jgi:HD-GYP domain-containing protein (c-di-GMP phosphodiesterase class II)
LRLREPKRVVQRLIDMLGNDEATLLGLTTVRCRENYTQSHAVNVCIFSLVVGKRLGMSKFQLGELGMAALFHDVGKGALPAPLLDQREELAARERELFEKHPLLGVKKVMSLKGLDVMTARIVTGIFEHHLLADSSGYPQLPYRRLSLLGRVISIADRFEELTSSRVHGRTPLPPGKALRLMMAEVGKKYDSGLLKLFMSCVGIHGVGGLLLLDTRELVVVVQNHTDPALWDHPKVKIIADAAGREVDGEIVDLADPDNRRLILADLDPHSFDLEVSRCLL